MKAWDGFWKSFDTTMAKLPSAINDIVTLGFKDDTSVGSVNAVIRDGDITLTGRFKSLRINGFLIRVPDSVMQPKQGTKR